MQILTRHLFVEFPHEAGRMAEWFSAGQGKAEAVVMCVKT